MHIAIIVPAFNVAPFLRDTLRSVLCQTHLDWSMVVVDDGSTDATADVTAHLRDPRIRLIRQQNAGVSAARNAGIAAFRSAHLASIGADIAVTPAWRSCPSGPNSAPNQHPLPVIPRHDPIGANLTGLDSRFANVSGPGRARSPSTGEVDAKKIAVHRTKPSHDTEMQIRTRDPISPAKPPAPDAYLFLDGDDWLAPDALALLAATLNDAPWAVAACGRYARVAMDGAICLSPPASGGCLLERLLFRNMFANGGHLLIRREAIETAGDFRPGLSYGEDWEYWIRLALLGEFASVRSRSPLLFVRERHGGATLSRAAERDTYNPVLDAIYHNPRIARRLGHARAAYLRGRAEAELAWVVGRELIRHGHSGDGQRWLGHSIRNAPSLRRLVLFGLSRLRTGPFRLYRSAT
jgi:GT2 family glycosyltransferase